MSSTSAAARRRPTSYASPSILARRRRILDETRKLITEQGLTGFSMEDLCARAGVAKRTLYNAFRNKEHLIAVAIHEYFGEFASRLRITSPPGTLDHMIERIETTTRRNLQLPNYNRALMAIYHSPEVSPDIWETIHEIATASHRPYVEALRDKKQLQPWIDAPTLVDDLTRYRYATGNDWCNGRIASEDFQKRLLTGVLGMLLGSTRGVARREIEQRLAGLNMAASDERP